jgi:hypothetical protein
MLTNRTPTDRDWLGLIQQIVEDPKNAEEAKTEAEEEREQILQKISYETVNGQPIFSNLDPEETQEERLFARKMFEWVLEKKIASSGLDNKSKTNIPILLGRPNYKGLPKSINKELTKNTDKTKASSFMVDITSLIIGIGHLLNRLKKGLLNPFTNVPPPLPRDPITSPLPKEVEPEKKELILLLSAMNSGRKKMGENKEDKKDQRVPSQPEEVEIPNAPPATSPDLMAAIRNNQLKLKKAADKKLVPPPPVVNLPSALKDRVAKANVDRSEEAPTNPEISDEEWEEADVVTPKKPALKVPAIPLPPPPRKPPGLSATKSPLPPKSDTARISSVLKSNQPVQQKKPPALPPRATPPATVPKSSVRSKIDFFKQLEQQQLPHGEQPKKSMTRVSHKQR